MAPFKVIIVGGSVAGLALANMLERYEIDFVVLEKHENIAPDLGACLGLLPNGLRIMDQLGCYEKILECSVPLNLLNSYDENGDAINKMSEVGVWMESLFGYKSLNQDRQQVIDVLFNNIRDKTKVHTSRGLEKIHPLPNGVKVKTADGSVYEGDIVVGADGVHSRVLDEMQRLAEIDTPNSKKFTRDNFECTYRALVCIGPRPKGIREDEGIKNCRKGRSHLCLSGQNGKWYFNIFEKTEHKTRGSSIPRYTKSDAHAMASAYANDILIPGVTFGDLYKNRTSSMLLPVEEGVLPRCFYNRIILVGDSYHKSTPLFGQGGNNCIVSAAYLANKLHSIKSYDSKPDDELIQNIFQNFQDTRHPETSLIATLGNRIQRLDAFENPVMKFINMKVLPELSSHYIWHAMAQAHTSTWLLDYLPFPSPSHGMLPSRNEIWLKPQVRCGKTNKVWMGLLILPLLAFSAIFWERNNQSPLSSVDTASRLDNEKAENLYFHLLDTAVTGFIAIESNRATYSMKLIGR
ncbi:Monooxygenase FAD-binding [Penicillium angulare]|uniref:Monooxygenase FAD-binding n=1 Tax=Penicillium angulare TaxID=116970 RepID=A0A9W9FYZ1_9EURO|nr:Monooxygenase FAD-binding [Penicillium angulare]